MSEEKQVKTVSLKERANSILDGAKDVYKKHPVACNVSTILAVAAVSFIAGRLTAPKSKETVKKEKAK